MGEGIVVFQKGIITFSNNAFKKIIQNINFDDDEVEVDLYEYKLFSLYRQDDLDESPRSKKNKNGPAKSKQ